jgi:hypothetical protein
MPGAFARQLSSLLIRILPLVDLFLPENLFRRIFSAKIIFFENFILRSAVMVAATNIGRRKGIETLERAPDDLLPQIELRSIFGEGDLNEKVVSGIGDFGFGADRFGGVGVGAVGGDINQDQSGL